MKTIFVAHDLLDIVNGTEVKLEVAGQPQTSWIQRNAKAMMFISAAMHQQLEYLITCDSAAEMWKKLLSIHEQTSATSKLLLTTRFHEYRMKSGDSVSQHIAKVENMARQLKDVGEAVSDVTIMAKILESLPSKYNAFVTAWDSVEEANQTIFNLTQRLIKEESQLTATDEAATALAAVNLKHHKKSLRRGKPRQHQESDVEHGKYKNFECHHCHNKGHIARYCKEKRNAQKSKDKKKRDANDDLDSGAADHDAFIASSDTFTTKCANANDVWFSNSGASQHMSFRKEWFVELEACNGITVSLGDNSLLEAEGRGTIIVKKLVNGEWQNGRLENVLYIPQLRKNLFSLDACTAKGHVVVVQNDGIDIYSRQNKLIAHQARKQLVQVSFYRKCKA